MYRAVGEGETASERGRDKGKGGQSCGDTCGVYPVWTLMQSNIGVGTTHTEFPGGSILFLFYNFDFLRNRTPVPPIWFWTSEEARKLFWFLARETSCICNIVFQDFSGGSRDIDRSLRKMFKLNSRSNDNENEKKKLREIVLYYYWK